MAEERAQGAQEAWWATLGVCGQFGYAFPLAWGPEATGHLAKESLISWAQSLSQGTSLC